MLPLSTLGRISQGPGAGDYVEVILIEDPFPNYEITTYSNPERSGGILDARMSTLDDVDGYVRQMGWTIVWP